MRRKITQKNIKKEKKALTKYALFAVAGILAMSSIFMTVQTATSSMEVSELMQKEEELTLEKRNLEGNLMRTNSVSDLEAKSDQMGYIKPAAIVYISDSQGNMAALP